MKTQQCNICGKVKPLDEFHSVPYNANGRQKKCAICTNIRSRERYHACQGGAVFAPRGPKEFDESDLPQKYEWDTGGKYPTKVEMHKCFDMVIQIKPPGADEWTSIYLPPEQVEIIRDKFFKVTQDES